MKHLILIFIFFAAVYVANFLGKKFFPEERAIFVNQTKIHSKKLLQILAVLLLLVIAAFFATSIKLL